MTERYYILKSGLSNTPIPLKLSGGKLEVMAACKMDYVGEVDGRRRYAVIPAVDLTPSYAEHSRLEGHTIFIKLSPKGRNASIDRDVCLDDYTTTTDSTATLKEVGKKAIENARDLRHWSRVAQFEAYRQANRWSNCR